MWKKSLTAAMLALVALSVVAPLFSLPKASAITPTGIAPASGTLPSDYQFQLTGYTNSYIKFGTNYYADNIAISSTNLYFTNIALGSASNAARNFGLGIQSGNATINAISTDTVTTGVTCTVATYCYDFYYYDLGTTLSQISVTQGSTTTNIPVSSFITDFSAFSVTAAPAVFWDPTTRYYEVKIYYTGTTSVSFSQNTGGTGINPVSFESASTVYSVASDPDFQHVYEDIPNNKAIFLDAEPTNGTYFESSYDKSTGISTNTATGITNGGNTVNSASYLSPVELNGYTWAVGRDSTTGKNVYALRTTSALAAVNATSVSSSYRPLDIAQSTSKLYSLLGDSSTQYGTLYMAQQTRAYGSYSETSILTGSSGTPAFANVADQSTSTSSTAIGNLVTARTIAEKFTVTAAMNGQDFNSMSLSLSKTGVPTGNATIGVFDASNNVVQTFATLDVSTLTGSQATYYFSLPIPYKVQADDRIGIKYTGGNSTNFVNVFWKGADVYDGTNAIYSEYGAGPWNDVTSRDVWFTLRLASAKTIVYDGSPDTTYTFFESGTNAIKVVKYNGSATLLSGSMTHTVGQPWSVIQLTDKMIIQTSSKTYVLPRATESISLLYPNTFNTRYEQSFLLSPNGRTYNSNPIYIANSTYAINFTPNLGTGVQTGVIVSSVDDSTGAMNIYAPAKYYYLTSLNLTAESSTLAGTTWTISQLGSLTQIAPTVFSEYVATSLVANSTLFSDDVIQLSCDAANYHYVLPMVAVGDDSGCNEWLIYDTPSGTAPRHIPYTRTADLVHANLYGLYTFTLNSADPTQYFLRTKYGGVTVDTGAFDSSAQLQQRLLYQQCYTIDVEEVNTGNSVQTGNVCAGDVTTKTISLTGVVIPPDWLKSTWSHSITRTFDNSTNNGLLFTVQKSSQPYNASIYVTDHPDPSHATAPFPEWFNFTNVSGASIANVTGVNSNETIFFTVYENEKQVVFDVSSGQGFNLGILSHIDDLGLLFGLPIALIFPILTAAVFPPSQRHIGIIATGAVIGIMQFFGFFHNLPYSEGMWAISFVIIALGVVMGRR